jgi:predicted nucleotidyltransferase
MADPGKSVTIESLQERLTAFAQQLGAALGPRLAMLASYGSVARGDFKPGQSDVNVLVVLDPVDHATLDAARPHLGAGRESLRLAPFVLGRDELAVAADAFASKLADIRLSYRVLHGADLLADLPIAFEDLRLATERELRNVQLRLRRAYLLGEARPELMMAALDQLLPHLFGAIRVLHAHRHGGQAPASLDDLLTATETELSYDPSALREAARARRAGAAPADVGGLYLRLLDAVGAITRAVDRMVKD